MEVGSGNAGKELKQHMNNYDLQGKRILFVGGGTGLDKAIIDRIHKSMYLQYTDNQFIATHPHTHHTHPHANTPKGMVLEFKYSNVYEIEKEIKEIVSSNGAFDAVVFTIVHSDFRPLQYAKPDLVSEIMNDNYGIFVEVVRALKKHRGLNERASIVAMSSISSIRAMKAKMAFCASKAALDAAVRCLSIELAPKGIRVNSIQKGAVDTDFEKPHIQNIQAIRSDETTIDNQAPLGLVKADEVAELVAFLLSDATRSLTGQSIAIDGGFTA